METVIDEKIWGPATVGAKLFINPTELPLNPETRTSVDVETDEKDNLVGVAVAQTLQEVYYFTKVTPVLAELLSLAPLIGHNLKGDFHWLNRTGLSITKEQLFADTMIMSYCINTNKESQALKDLAKEYLGWVWPTYKEMTGKKRTKDFKTLDKVEVEKVAKYCGMDCLAVLGLDRALTKKMDDAQWKFYNEIELPMTKILFEMEAQGVRIDREYLSKLDIDFGHEEDSLLAKLREFVGPVPSGKKKNPLQDFNPRSPSQVGKYLFPKCGINSKATNKPVLFQHKSVDIIATLIKFREISKLRSTYTVPLQENDGVVHTTYSQVSMSDSDGAWKGIRTGRLSSSEPNLQNIPTRTKKGNLLRSAFVPREGYQFIRADYSQIEYRLLAHFTQEQILLDAFKAGKDVHEETAKLFGVGRYLGKTLNFAAIYGAQAKRMALTVNMSGAETLDIMKANELLTGYWQRLPNVSTWVMKTKFEAKYFKGIRTMFNRWIPLPGIAAYNKFERWHWERAAVNYIIQGSAAEIIKVATIELRRRGYIPVLQVHDELVYEFKPEVINERLREIKDVMENIVKLSVPLQVSPTMGVSWNEAKNG